MQSNCSVAIEDFAVRHFIKGFERKYKAHWESTLRAIVAELERIDMFINTNKAETIVDAGSVRIVKTKFKIAGTQESAKTSGNRCIVAWRVADRAVSVLLVYAKTDISGNNETAQWQKIVHDAYPAYGGLL